MCVLSLPISLLSSVLFLFPLVKGDYIKDMSSDTAKENTSVVDSSVTEWKHDRGNSDDPESSGYRADEDGYLPKEKGRGNSHVRKEILNTDIDGKLYKTRYFVIKSLNYDNIQLSIEKGIWATQLMNEPVLEEAFNNAGRVILIFSVNMSGFFQGYAQMMSSVGWRRDNVWSQATGKSNPWGRSFKVKWLRLNDLPFQKTLHLKNPLNDYKPVKISRDCQELPEDIGEALCELLDGKGNEDDSPNSFPRDYHPMQGHCIDAHFILGGEGYNMPSLPMPWATTPVSYPPYAYQDQAEANRLHLAQQRSSGVTDYNHVASGATKATGMKQSRSNLQGDEDASSRFDLWGVSAESPHASTLTEDDFLEMSYEEYLEAHSRNMKQWGFSQADALSLTVQESSSKMHEDDLDSRLGKDWGAHCKRSHQSS